MGRRIAFSLLLLLWFFNVGSGGSGILTVHHKFGGRKRSSIGDLRAHDGIRHGRMLSAVDLPMGGLGLPSDAGLYYAQIGIGTPSKNYYVQVDTGSDILWVNCIQCRRCPRKSDLGIRLTLYDPKGSTSGTLVSCADEFCSSTYDGPIPGCSQEVLCQYSVMYGDGSTTNGYFVNDFVQYNQVSGNLQTRSVNASVIFGCGAQQSGDLGSSSEALDGILGFGQSNSSMISQLAASGKVKKMFAHCLDSVNGGGIFAIGHVVEPKVNTTPLVPNQAHYNVNLKAIEVGGSFLQLPSDVFDTGDRKGTIIDSGTTLAYLPDTAYTTLMNKIMSYKPNLNLQTIQDFECFEYAGSVDDVFPLVKLHFENSLSLTVNPHDYLFQNNDGSWCVGWQNSGVQSKDGKDMFLLGDLVLSNKLVVYDLEKQVIGWKNYNCSSSIKVQDDKTGAVYSVGAHDISSASRLELRCMMLLLTAIFLYFL
ncbi:Aspartic proteinase-like protein 2 [Acorus gramineus]|uniref:Aspartic proteinase-like protein 2 n=1 Tax=Acorus gramineus TaxID=55184 RepID=A0AAV9A0M1_ACOGR|nr:Aspartic proteinase-like protein 2 [Acorus gramineus]